MTSDMIELHPVKNEFEETEEVQTAPEWPEYITNVDIANNVKPTTYKKVTESNAAGRLQKRVPDAPDNLIELVFSKKCSDCSNILATVSSALAHYNSTKHQTKLAFLFLPHGIYNLPLSKEEIREIETGISKSDNNESKTLTPRTMPLRELVKKFEIKEDIRKLNMEFCRICETQFSSKVGALQHYSSKKHKINADNCAPYNPRHCIDLKDELRCDACNVIATSPALMESHLTGKKHQQQLKAYLNRVNAGTIPPPMSSRGFCDFNYVEREEANPLDPSEFVQNQLAPIQLQQTEFMNTFPPNYGAITPNYPTGSNVPFVMPGTMYCVQQDASMVFRDNCMPPLQSQPVWNNTQIDRTQINSPYAPNISTRIGNKAPLEGFGPTKFKYASRPQH